MNIEDEAVQIAQKQLSLREGRITKIYLDSLGKPTGGIGHLLTPDELKIYSVGSPVSDEQINTWFMHDVPTALRISLIQWKEIGILTAEFLAALISVNFQLGNFSIKFPKTYQLLKMHKFDQVISNLRLSNNGKTWYDQTPIRVEDFIQAIENR